MTEGIRLGGAICLGCWAEKIRANGLAHCSNRHRADTSKYMSAGDIVAAYEGADLAVPSWEAVMQRRPSGVIMTSTTQPLWPSRTALQRPVSTSHTRALKSSPAVIARRASGVRATAHTPGQSAPTFSSGQPRKLAHCELPVQRCVHFDRRVHSAAHTCTSSDSAGVIGLCAWHMAP